MWTSPQFLTIPFVLFLSVTLIDAVLLKNELSLFGPYEEGAANLAFWDLSGSAQLGESVIRLTTDEPGKKGGVWNKYRVFSNDWEVHVQFHIHGKGLHHNGEGMAIWYVRDPLHVGPLFGSKELFSGLGIFIDTHEDKGTPHKHKHPYISAVVNNGSMYYAHNEDGTAGQIGGCHIPLRNLEWPTRIAVSYISNVLTVFLDTEGTGEWKECFRTNGVHLPTNYAIGVSASTGDISDNHDIISITTLDMASEDKVWEDKELVVPHAEFMQIPPKFLKDRPKEEKPKTEEAADEDEEASAPPASFMRKAMYVIGIGVLLLVAVGMCRKYSAQRKERMQKRLF